MNGQKLGYVYFEDEPGADVAKAEAYFERALAVARQQQARSWELRAAMSMARLWRDQGKPQQARELLARIYGWFTEGDTRDLKEAKALFEELQRPWRFKDDLPPRRRGQRLWIEHRQLGRTSSNSVSA